MKKSIVVIEDDQAILDLIIFNLKKENYETHGFAVGIDGLHYLLKHGSDLLILDLMLPDIDGLEICKDLRTNEKTRHLPIIILTAKGEETDKVLGLELGADDYMVKPFSPKELIARIKALLRRTRVEPTSKKDIIDYAGLVVDTSKHLVSYENKEITLTATEFKILETLIRAPKRVFTRAILLDLLDKTTIDRNVDVHITNIRKKLGMGGRLIRTIRGVGYKLDQ
jgi:DNA-binding response OmpR family regulator